MSENPLVGSSSLKMDSVSLEIRLYFSGSSEPRMCSRFHDGMPGSVISVSTVEVGINLYIHFSATRRFLVMLS